MHYLSNWLLDKLNMAQLSDFDLACEISRCAYEEHHIPSQLYHEAMRRKRPIDCCYFFRDNGSCWLWDPSRCIQVEPQYVEALRLCLAPFGVKEDRPQWEERLKAKGDNLYAGGRTLRNYALLEADGALSELEVCGIARIGFIIDDSFEQRPPMLLKLGCPVYSCVTDAMDACIKSLMQEQF